MVRKRLRSYHARIWTRIERLLDEDHTPHEVATSFAVGTFIVSFPTAGMAIPLFVVGAYFFERVSKLALLSTLLVFNPPVKWAIYAFSYYLGVVLLGPTPTGINSPIDARTISFSAAPEILIRYLVGNFVTATILAIVGYLLVWNLLRLHTQRALDVPRA